jgi:hypothetical protein
MDETPYPAASGSGRRRRLAIQLQAETIGLSAPLTANNSGERAESDPAQPDPATNLSHWLRLIRRTEPLTWLFTGDSYTVSGRLPARGACHASYLVRLIRDRLGRDRDAFVTTARPTFRLSSLLHEFHEAIERFQPGIVVVSCSGQELNREGALLAQFEETIRRVVEKILLTGGMPVLATPPCPVPLADTTVSKEQLLHLQAIRACATETPTLLVDHWEHWERSARSDWYRSDGCSLSDRGALEMAQWFVRSLGLDRLGPQGASVTESSVRGAAVVPYDCSTTSDFH